MITRIGFLSFLFILIVSTSTFARVCPSPWLGAANGIQDCQLLKMKIDVDSVWTGHRWTVQAWIRNGYLEANPSVPFKGNVIYYEGLGDSMLNHMPLFRLLTDAGYRVIAFDYMGQGGSTGSMNDTRITTIGAIGRVIWNRQARDLANFPKHTIIGWSTGGLAAYSEASMRTDVDKVVLIAPGLVPNMLVGEQHPLRGQIDLITLSTLTKGRHTKQQRRILTSIPSSRLHHCMCQVSRLIFRARPRPCIFLDSVAIASQPSFFFQVTKILTSTPKGRAN